ncbi:MAG: winged helix-turn-helix transcriptional regulator [Candidatus Berkelbacteria bacterium]|nr:MAG: winged helix-turn-helix transcriptional regulator [Candidatus Berkelbacteria bacterium]QQG51957.1 MAG: winged helix-turn-helix transcriptional regulator [Candidatus Berkelbacteria bacterium]
MMRASKNLANIKREITDSEAVKACARRHGTIGDPTAMKICYLFRHYPELSVGQIAELVSISISAASRQLKKLKKADILSSSKDAQTVYYTMQSNEFTKSLLNELGVSK